MKKHLKIIGDFPFSFWLLLIPLLTVFTASVGFWIGAPCSAWNFWFSCAVAVFGATCSGWRKPVALCVVSLCCLVLTAFTFSYSGTDALNYHFPMQFLLREGWNPLFESTFEKLSGVTSGKGWFFCWHTLFLPKFAAMNGALVAKATGLWIADSYLGYMLAMALFCEAFSFARRFWALRKPSSFLIALSMVFSTKFTSFLAGQVDYHTYATFGCALMALVLYSVERKVRDLLVACAATVICMSCKTTGILACGVLWVMMFPIVAGLWPRPLAQCQCRKEHLRVAVLASLTVGFLVVVVGSAPLLTAWIQYGSPFYPSMTFNPLVETRDLTFDFTGNADALSMGRISRMAYAWISPRLTVYLLSIIRGCEFCPRFTVGGGVAGLGMWFNCLLALSVVGLMFSKKNLVTFACLVVFVASNFAPLKYIGYSRYFPQIWLIVPLAFGNFIATGFGDNGRWRVLCVLCKAGGLLSLGLLSSLIVLRCAAYQGRMFALEKLRQQMIVELEEKQDVCSMRGGEYQYTFARRLEQGGLRLIRAEDDGCPTMRMQVHLGIPNYDACSNRVDEINKRYPICDKVSDLTSFRWVAPYFAPPRILWYNSCGSSR